MADRLRIASFNANSIRNRLEVILNWMAANEADAVCVQETKVQDHEFPIDPIREAGYHCAFWGQKTFNGVAIVAREPLEDVETGLGIGARDEEARIIRARIRGVNVVNTYVPQGTDVTGPRFQFKLDWIRGMRGYLSARFSPSDPVVWVGDLNVAREPIDVYDPDGLLGGLCYHPDEHAALDHAMEWGLVDVFRKHHPGEPNLYSFWDYRVPNALKRRMGWRLDHILATKPLADVCTDCWIDTKPRQLDKPSDHTFIAADFDVKGVC
jgi:exodeoxyribonuclease-3